ncbi:CDP-archaeol synthase [uncultured archaeon]|nr:CDP-archaeol synthase [uncultured archaeon]
MLDFTLKLLLYIAPMYFANSCAMVFGRGKRQVDFGAKFSDGRPVFGPGKTYRGLLAGVAAGTAASVIIWLAFPNETMLLTSSYLGLGFLLSVGAVTGDLVKSFFKRRAGIEQGKDLFIVDQLDFVAGGVLFGWVFYAPSAAEMLVIAVLTIIVHRLSNLIAFKFNLKKVPW